MKRISFNSDWRFHLGDIKVDKRELKGPIYTEAKTQDKTRGPASVYYDDRPDDYSVNEPHQLTYERWEFVTLPHDYMINEPILEKENVAGGFFEYKNAWYRKHFILPNEYNGNRIEIEFGGIATECEIFVNGSYVLSNKTAFVPVIVDITDYAKFGEENVIAVYVKANQNECWWYAGGGIYRNTYLCVSAPVHIKRYGIYIKPELKEDKTWFTPVYLTIENDLYENRKVNYQVEIIDDNNKVVAVSSGETELLPYSEKEVEVDFTIVNPKLWSPDNPNLYWVKAKVTSDNLTCEKQETFGFRTLEFTANDGLYINGEKTYINGVCGHEHFCFTGKAIPDNIVRYQVKILKEMCANGYRCSHYMYSEEYMNEFDRQGMLVMAETRHFATAPEYLQQLKTLVLRDRNRPSVIMWSIGNEEHYFITEQGKKMAEKMTQIVKSLDGTRPVMTANDKKPEVSKVYDASDIVGINYNLDIYEAVRKNYPNKCFVASECAATSSTRGWYLDDCLEKAYLSAYDKDTNNWFLGREKTHQKLASLPFVAGWYQWIGIEHRGEAYWPRICSQAGAIDLFLQRKDAFYQNKSFWSKEPTIHLLPHWNMEGYPSPVKVWAYTNCEEAELFLNGESLGKIKTGRFNHGEWFVPFTKGELKVVGYNGGKAVVSDKKVTSKKGTALKLEVMNPEDLTAKDGTVILYRVTVVDEDGVEDETATANISVSVSNVGTVIGTGSDIADHVPMKETVRKMRAGKMTVGVKLNGKKGKLTLVAESYPLTPCAISYDI